MKVGSYDMGAFSNQEQEAIHEAVQEMLRKGYTPEQVMKAMAQIMVHITKFGVDIEDANFTVRTYNVLKRSGIDTVDQLKKMSYLDITSLKNISRKSVEEIEDRLGIEFK